MAKSRFFRVAVEGATTDGRVIERSWIEEMVASYNPTTYGARVNMEHLRGYSPEPPFNAYGDVVALEARDVELDLDGKKVVKLALYAQIDANDQLVAINRKGQKLYTSIEVNPSFAGTGKAYLMGLAVTDSPASLGTEMLQFAAQAAAKDPAANPFAGRKQAPGNLFTAASEFKLELELDPVEPAAKVFASFGDKLIAALGAAFSPGQAANAPKAVEPTAAVDLSAVSKVMTEGFAEIGRAIEASAKHSTDAVTALRGEFDALKAEVEGVEKRSVRRPAATGGSGRILADY